MSYVTVVWSMVASACLTLAAVNLLVWCKKRTQWANLLFALTAAGTAGVAFCELWLMRAETVGESGMALRWGHVPYWVLIISLIGFARLYMRAGRLWLAWTVCGLRTLSLVLNFVFTPNINYREITVLRHVRFLGESVSVVEGIPNPWMLVGQISLLLLLIFLVDVALTLWRRGERRSLLILSITMIFFIATGTAQFVLGFWRGSAAPLTPSLFFLGVVAVMAWEVSRETIRAAQLSDDLRESEERMTLASEAAGFGVWMWSVARNQIWGSERWLGLFGFSADASVTFESVIQRIHPDDREMVERAVRRALEDRNDYAGEYRLVLPDNTQRWVAARGRVYPDTQGKSVRMMGATTDITARKQAEDKAQQQYLELAHLSRLSILGEISGSLAHELNQPLGAILANAQATRRRLADEHPNLEEIRAATEDIIRDDKRAGEIVHRVRALAKKDAPKSQLLDVNRVARETAALLRSELVAADVPLSFELQPDLPAVKAGHVELQQSLLNLMLNGLQAQQATERSRRGLTVTTHHAGGTVIMAVRDRGPGLSPEIASRVFDAFFTTKPGGLGLGLAFCRRIAENYGGKLWAENNPDGGAVFSLSLPASPPQS